MSLRASNYVHQQCDDVGVRGEYSLRLDFDPRPGQMTLFPQTCSREGKSHVGLGYIWYAFYTW